MEEIQLTWHFQAGAQLIYDTWLSSQGHTEMTGSLAECDPVEGAGFSAWEGYITGKNLILEPGRRIVQAWRTTEFSPSDPDSRLEIRFESTPTETLVQLLHTNIPTGQAAGYAEGWHDYYLVPMKSCFGEDL